jgi:hypothetical protein
MTETEINDHGPKGGTDLKLIDGSGYMRKRNVRKVIRFRCYGKMEDSYNYNRERCMLFVPWRNEEIELLNPELDIIKKAANLSQLIHVNSTPYFFNAETDGANFSDIMADVEAELNEDLEEEIRIIGNDMELIDPEVTYEERFCEDIVSGNVRIEQFLPPRSVPDVAYRKLMQSLNVKQRMFALSVLHRLKTSEKPFYYFLSGGAGVGKSHVVTAIVQSYMRYSGKIPNVNPDQACVIVAAPTGKAAFNVFGMTLHSTFKLPPTQYCGKLCDLDDGPLSTVRKHLFAVKLFIIDEISMVSLKMFYEVDQRLRQIYGTSLDFGGRSILVVSAPCFHVLDALNL